MTVKCVLWSCKMISVFILPSLSELRRAKRGAHRHAKGERLRSRLRSHEAPHRSQSQYRTVWSRLSSNLVTSLSSFFSQFDQIWWYFFLGFVCVSVLRNEWYYIFVWQLRKCEQQVENVFFMVFSRTQPNTRKYFSKHFLKCNQTHENIFLSGK